MIDTEIELKTDEPLTIDPHDFLDAKVDKFEDSGLHETVLEAVTKLGWATPTPVQALCLPFTTKGRDVAGFAQTGTGKTGVFLLTIAHRLATRASSEEKRSPIAVVLAPTRELAMQISHDAEGLYGSLNIKVLAVFGGIDYEAQAQKIKSGIDVIVATPGRLKDYAKKKIVRLDAVEVFVCDEADRMFDMGFIEDVEYFLDKLKPETQKLLFSATTNDQVKELAFEYLENPEYISVNPETLTPENIDQMTVICEAHQKVKVLLGLIQDEKPECAIIFTNTKLVADWLFYKLTKNGLEADMITGDLAQRKRINLIKKIKRGELKFLIATDVASRGLHISGVTHVFNFDLPDEPANYVHRIGRTARAGAKGKAFSLVCEDYGENLAGIQNLLEGTIELRSEWFDPRYLKIEDQSGDPFQDPDFKAQTTSFKDSRRRDEKRTAPAAKPEASAPRKKAQDRPKRPKKTTDQPHRTPKPPKASHQAAHKKPLPAAPEVPTGLFAMIKMFFKAMFSRRG